MIVKSSWTFVSALGHTQLIHSYIQTNVSHYVVIQTLAGLSWGKMIKNYGDDGDIHIKSKSFSSSYFK